MDNLQVIERFASIAGAVHDAVLACSTDHRAPDALKEQLGELAQRADEVKQMAERPEGLEVEDPALLFAGIDTLKSIADRATQIGDEADGLDGALCDRIHEMQSEIAHFRRQLHGHEMRREARPAIGG